MACLLNIETSGLICSVCLADNDHLIAEFVGREENDHAAQLTNLIQACLDAAEIKITQLDAVAVSAGPGSYTGLRIGTSTAKGICHALQIPLIAVDTLQAMAYGASLIFPDNYLFCPLIDAKRMEVFTAVYDFSGKPVVPSQPMIVDENFLSALLDKNKIVFFGSGLEKCIPFLSYANAILLKQHIHTAKFMTGIASLKFKNSELADLAYFEPSYLKPVYTTVKKAL